MDKGIEHLTNLLNERLLARPRGWERYLASLRLEAKGGSTYARRELGLWYLDGKRLRSGRVILIRSPKVAVRWLGLAAEKGDTTAAITLGNCCHDGVGMESNVNLGRLWYRRAFAWGDAVGASNWGVSYRMTGHVVLAEKWWLRAALAGDVDAEIAWASSVLNRHSKTTTKQHAVRRLKRIVKLSSGSDRQEARDVLQATTIARGKSKIGTVRDESA